jgi:Trk-type K+ transport system membrane component
VLILLAFIVMSLLEAIPYVYLDPFQSPTLNDRVTNSLFEVGSALTTNGISMGTTSLSLPTFYKFVPMVTMIIGKVEILIVLFTIYLSKPIISGAVKVAASRLRGFVKGIVIG